MVSGFKISTLVCVFVALAGCSTFAPKSDSEQVEQRSRQRLELILDGKIDKAYAFMTPGYRAANPVARFRADFAAGASRIIDAQVRSSTCEEDACTVNTAVTYNHVSSIGSPPFPIERVTQERWIRLDGQWWLLRLN